MGDPRVVLLVVPNLDIGGAQQSALTLARALPGAGLRAAVATFRDGPLRAELDEAGVPVEVLPRRRHPVVALPWFVADMLRLRRALLDTVRRYDADVVQIQTLGTLAFLVMTLRWGTGVQLWWRIANVTFLVKDDGSGPRWLFAAKRAAHRLLYRVGARMVDGVIAVSDEVARAFREETGSRGARLVVVLNGVDVDRFPAASGRDDLRTRLGLDPETHLMTMVGTFKEQKGHRFLIEAAASAMPAFPQLTIALVGSGDLEADVRARIDDADLAARFLLLGDRRDVPELLAASDSFVLPSLWEGFSVALLEAMASGLPVVATAVSGTTQVMQDGRTGWLVPPGDAGALAAAMKEVLSDPAHAGAMGTAARLRVEDGFGARSQARAYAGLYREARR